MNVYSLVDPFGLGIVIAFAMYVIVSVTALIVGHRVYTKTRRGLRSVAQLVYEYATVTTLLFLVHLTFYVPQALKSASLEEHGRIVSNAALSGFLFGIVGTACLVWAVCYGSLFRARSVWHWPFMWLALTQWALLQYGVGASMAHHKRYMLELQGMPGIELHRPWRFYLMLGGAFVLMVVAFCNLVLALQAQYRTAEIDFKEMIKDSPYKNRLVWQRQTVRGALASFVWSLVPLKVYALHTAWRLNRAAKPAAPAHEPTWLDTLVIVLSNMHNAPPPWSYPLGDTPDDGDGRRDANRT